MGILNFGKAIGSHRRTLATSVIFINTLTVFLLLLFSSMAAAQGTLSPTGSMLFERTFFTLTRLPDGKVLAAGANGAGNVGFNTAEVYNPTTGTVTVQRGEEKFVRSEEA